MDKIILNIKFKKIACSKMGSKLEYDTTAFAICSSFTCIWVLISEILVFINIKRHSESRYQLQIKKGILICFGAEMFMGVLLVLSVFLYKLGDIFLIIINVIACTFVLYFYIYVQENLTYYLWKLWTTNKDLKYKIVPEAINRRLMFKYRYPMKELSWFKGIRVRDYYWKYWYLLEGKAKVFYYFDVNINSFAEAYTFQRDNTVIVFWYILTVPLVLILETSLNRLDAIKIEGFNLSSLFSGYHKPNCLIPLNYQIL